MYLLWIFYVFFKLFKPENTIFIGQNMFFFKNNHNTYYGTIHLRSRLVLGGGGVSTWADVCQCFGLGVLVLTTLAIFEILRRQMSTNLIIFYTITLFYFGEYIIDYTVKLGNKEWFDKEQIGIKEPFPVTNLPFTS
jgi:hypothetical protein